MKNMILVFALTLTASTTASAHTLSTWEMSSNSVQALLYEGLAAAYEADLASPYPQKTIKLKKGSFLVKLEKTVIACASKSLGTAAVQSYRCYVRGDLKSWTNSSKSPQAVLHDVLMAMYETNLKSSNPHKQIEMLGGGAVALTDGKTTLTCTGRTFGAMMVQTYNCEIK